MRKERRFARAVAVLVAALLAVSAPLNAAAAVVNAPVLTPTALPLSAGAAALAAPALNAAPALAPSLAVPGAPLSFPAAPAAVPSAAAPVPVAQALRAAARPAAMAGPAPSDDSVKAAAGRSFDVSAARPADEPSAVPAAASNGAAPLAAATTSPRKALPVIPALPARRFARARAYAPKIMLAAGAGLAVWALNHFGIHPAVLAAPLAMLAGTLGSNEGMPSPSLLAQFMAQAAAVAPPGKVLSGDETARIGQRLALDSGQLQQVLMTLMERGDLGLQDNRAIVHYSFASRVRAASGPQTSESLGDLGALAAVKLLNSGAPLDHAKGLNEAAGAVALYERAERETGLNPPQLAEARVLRANLALEHLGDMIRAHKAAVEKARPADDAFRIRRAADADAVLDWLKTATYAVDAVPPLPKSVHAKALEILLSLNPRDEQGRQGDNLVSAYIEAVDLLEKYDPANFSSEGAAKTSGAESSSDAATLGLFLVKEVMPAERIGDEAVQAALKTFGWDAARARNALTELARRGYVVIRDNGAMIMTSLPYRQGEEGLGDTHADALAAVKLLNSTDPLDHLRAVARLDKAKADYVRLLRAAGRHDAIFEEASILFGNAVLEAAGDALRGLERALRESLSGERPMPAGATRDDLGRRMVDVQKALEWLKTAAYSADRRFEMPADLARSMHELLDLRAFREIVMGKVNGDMDIVRGTRLVRDFLARNAEGGRALSSGTGDVEVPATHGGFRPLSKSEYGTLLEYGTDLTQKAADGKMRPMIGRKAEIRQMLKTLLRVEKNNPLVIGEKGVGKTAIVNGLAEMIATGLIPELRGRNVIKIDLNKVVAGTTLRGQFEERMQGIIDEARKSNGRVILFIDEIHMIIGAGDSDKATDAAQILKESLADGSVSLIGATTLEEFRRIEKDGALMRRFNPVTLLPPTKGEAEAIVEGVKKIYEDKHKVTIGAETVAAAVALASRYVTDRHLPDSALDLMDDASAEVELKASEAKKAGVENPSRAVTAEDIAKEISMRTGIPAGKLNEDKRTQLRNLPKDMKGQVIGQDEAVEAVAEAVQAGETGYRDPKQPIASFVFLGPTGVGKTELARALAKVKFGSEKNMLRLDMSEYQEKHSVSRLISAPPGYAGHDEGGQLTESVRRNPYQVILLDEIEKAHPDVFDVLLQVLEDGRLTDGQGRTVDFSNTIIIMTSNIGGSLAGEENAPKRAPMGFHTGAEQKADDGYDYKLDGMGFGAKIVKTPRKTGGPDGRKEKYLDEFKKKYRPEFVNRIGEDRVIVFNELTEKSQLGKILDLRLIALQNQLKDKSLTVTLTGAAREAVLAKALSQSRYGARPIKQIVDREINRALKDAELDGRIADGDSVVVDWNAAEGRYTADKSK